MATARFTFSMDAVKDAQYIRLLELEPNTSAAIRAAVIAWYDRPSHHEIDAKLDRVLDALRGVQVIGAASSDQEQAEPARARAGLEKMKAKFRR